MKKSKTPAQMYLEQQKAERKTEADKIARICAGVYDWQGMRDCVGTPGLMDECNRQLKKASPTMFSGGWRIVESHTGVYLAINIEGRPFNFKGQRVFLAHEARYDAFCDRIKGVFPIREDTWELDYAKRHRARHLLRLVMNFGYFPAK